MSANAMRPGKEIEVRRFRSEDAADFRRLNETWISKYFRIEEKDREVLGDPQGRIIATGGEIFVATVNGTVAGCVAMLPIGNEEYELAKMAVDERFRGRGLGRRLIAEAIGWARMRGARRVYLETNHSLTPAIGLYEAMGFQHIPEERWQPSPYQRANVYMERWLDVDLLQSLE